MARVGRRNAKRASLEAQKAWISTTSQEDCSDGSGVLDLSVLQCRLTMPHLGQGELKKISRWHILPLEIPDAQTSAIEAFKAMMD